MKKILYGEFLQGRYAIGVLVLRVVVGAAFIYHGWGKIQQPFGWMGADSSIPGIFQGLAALSEFGGGIALILGLLAPLAALGLACTMVVAIGVVHLPQGHTFVSGRGGSYELAAVYLAIMILLVAAGPGTLSLDYRLFGKK
ncbi:MAG: DoxX family protein [Candidatus Omnitrophota bacterium]|nr:DoxX family protein [Candidatus Omnitrophota bacterium]